MGISYTETISFHSTPAHIEKQALEATIAQDILDCIQQEENNTIQYQKYSDLIEHMQQYEAWLQDFTTILQYIQSSNLSNWAPEQLQPIFHIINSLHTCTSHEAIFRKMRQRLQTILYPKTNFIRNNQGRDF